MVATEADGGASAPVQLLHWYFITCLVKSPSADQGGIKTIVCNITFYLIIARDVMKLYTSYFDSEMAWL